MKKSCLVAVITVLAAVAGALAAVAVYLHRREKELDEYERLLFGEDDAATVEPEAAAEEAALQRMLQNKNTNRKPSGAPAVCKRLCRCALFAT